MQAAEAEEEVEGPGHAGYTVRHKANAFLLITHTGTLAHPPTHTCHLFGSFFLFCFRIRAFVCFARFLH